jgi:hypothetical protein
VSDIVECQTNCADVLDSCEDSEITQACTACALSCAKTYDTGTTSMFAVCLDDFVMFSDENADGNGRNEELPGRLSSGQGGDVQ